MSNSGGTPDRAGGDLIMGTTTQKIFDWSHERFSKVFNATSQKRYVRWDRADRPPK